MSSFTLGRIGSLISGGGIAWAVYAATRDLDLNSPTFIESTLRNIFMQTGPLEVCAAGVLIWLLAKWRSSVVMR